MNIPYYIECILKERKITDLLRSRGIFPAKQLGNKILYHCPLHEGDNDPSFMVFTDKEYENYYCFSCHSGITVINLLSELDGISTRQATKNLIKGLDIKEQDVIESIVKYLKTNKVLNNSNILGELSLKISVNCYNYLQELSFDQEESDFLDKFFKLIDHLVTVNDISTLQEIYDILVEYGIPKRVEKYLEKQEQRIIQSNVNKEQWLKI